MNFLMRAAVIAALLHITPVVVLVKRPDAVQTLLPRVSLKVIDSESADDPAFAAYDQVRVRLSDGRELNSPEIRYARGHFNLPLSRAELWTKFKDCTAKSLAATEAAALFETLQAIETVKSIRDLRRAPAARAKAS